MTLGGVDLGLGHGYCIVRCVLSTGTTVFTSQL